MNRTERPNRKEVGRIGEAAAAVHLELAGWILSDRNWRCRMGEIDLIGRPPGDTGEIVFVEVRTRRAGGRFGTALESVDYRKQRQVRTIAQIYLDLHHLWGCNPRFDVIAVMLDHAMQVVELKHLEGAF
ncbi:YraN family protein [Paenibacillus tarimensis]